MGSTCWRSCQHPALQCPAMFPGALAPSLHQGRLLKTPQNSSRLQRASYSLQPASSWQKKQSRRPRNQHSAHSHLPAMPKLMLTSSPRPLQTWQKMLQPQQSLLTMAQLQPSQAKTA